MYFSSVSNKWIGIQGAYGTGTYTFTLDHCDYLVFVNPPNTGYAFMEQLMELTIGRIQNQVPMILQHFM